MPGRMRLFVRIEDGSSFVLVLQDNLLPEHYKEIALQRYREQWTSTRQPPELLLIRRVIFRNKDQLMDFRRRKTKKSGEFSTAPGQVPLAAAAVAGGAKPGGNVYDASATVELIRQEMVVTNPPQAALLSLCETELIVKGITLNRLIIKMTDPMASPYLEEVFLVTYRAYATPQQVVDLLIQRFDVPELCRPGRPQRSPLDEAYYAEAVRGVQMKVVSFFEHWVSECPYDFADDRVHASLNRWLREKIDKDGIPAKCLTLLRTKDRSALRSRKFVPPPGTLNRMLSPTHILSKYHPKDIAAQLTLLTLHAHNYMEPMELLHRQWEGPDAVNVPNFIAYRDCISRVSNWVTYAVVSEKEQSVRANNLEVLLLVCEELLKLHNYDMVVAVHGGVSEPPVQRLTNTFALLPSETVPLATKFDELLSTKGMTKAFKSAMSSSPRPHFPSIAVHMKDLVALDEAPAVVEGMINWMRCMQQYNLVKFLLDGKGSRLEYIADLELQGVFSFWKIVDDKVLSALSLELQ